MVLGAGGAGAQGLQLETRVEALTGRTTAVHGVLGANGVAGTYVRIGVLAGGGARRTRDTWKSSGRVDVAARVHVDPLRQYSWGAYAGGGATWLFDADEHARAGVLAFIGYEGPVTSSRWILGVEVGVGGGVRIAVTARRARAIGR
jgi:hypothetical protein